MGTNYYIRDENDEEIHLGKSSAGWKFSFQYNGGRYYKNIEEMREWLKDKKIWDEYDYEISYEKFWELVKAKKDGKCHTMAQKMPCHTDSFNIDGHNFTDGAFS